MPTLIELPDTLTDKIAARGIPPESVGAFALEAISAAVDFGGVTEDADDAADCIAAVEEALAGMEAGRSMSLEEASRRWDEEWTAHKQRSAVR